MAHVTVAVPLALALVCLASSVLCQNATLPRVRRAIVRDEALRWPEAVVPYKLEAATLANTEEMRSIMRGMGFIQQHTCLRFREWGAMAAEELSHQGFLDFINTGECMAEIGFKNKAEGQIIRCCDTITCMHELGHALGLLHEHLSPAHQGWTRVDADHLSPDRKKEFTPIYKESYVISNQFDIQSAMSYGPEGYSFLWSDIKNGENLFYLLKDLSIGHNCEDIGPCAGSTLTCANDGFRSVVGGVCACVCPRGLDPAQGCRDVITASPVTKYPAGKWALPMPKSGCPPGFVEGYRAPVSAQPRGPHTYSDSYHLKGGDEWHLQQSFCVKSDTSNDDLESTSGYWGQGDYCLLRYGDSCPPLAPNEVDQTGFKQGWTKIDFWTHKDVNGVANGTLPDSELSDQSAKWFYCCRQAGFTAQFPMQLPNQTPLALPVPLYGAKYSSCPKILGMHEVSEELGIGGNTAYQFSDDKIHHTPYVSVESHGSGNWLKRVTFRHCYYQPANMDCGGAVELSAASPSHVVTSPQGDFRDCTWLVTASEGSRIVVDIAEANIAGDCGDQSDRLELRTFLMGQEGVRHCGDKGTSVVSFSNVAILNYITKENSKSSFKATFSLLADSDLCYLRADRGFTYGGTTSVTRGGRRCLNWADVAHCHHNAFNEGDKDARLDSNHCRNPDPTTDFQPWCYTDAAKCTRDYCDVCNKAPAHDRADAVECDLIKQGGCLDADQASYKCAKTCGVIQEDTSKALTARCPAPPPLADGAATEARDSWSVGDQAIYACTADPLVTASRTCLSTGCWSPLATACPGCPEGWSLHDGRCFKYFPTTLTGDAAQKQCEALGGNTAMPKDEQTNEFIKNLRTDGRRMWLGAYANWTDNTTAWVGAATGSRGGAFEWRDGDALTWTNWAFTRMWRTYVCARQTPAGPWMATYCNMPWQKGPYMCERPALASGGTCVDASPECPQWFAAKPEFCQELLYLADKCKRTCESCHTDEDDCPLPAPGSAVETADCSLAAWTAVPSGQTVEFRCRHGRAPLSGDVTRTCTAGAWAGAPLVCEEADEADACLNDPCDANATCEAADGRFGCSCNTGYQGDGFSCTDINECVESTPCDENATCVNTEGGFECSCISGFQGDGFTCSDINECVESNPCDVNAVCLNTAGGVGCSCNTGYQGDGFTCSDINECVESNPCDVNALCVNIAGGVECSCNTGYQGDGISCTDINECADSSPCGANAACKNTDGGFECSCNTGYQGDGFSCTDKDECTADSDPCDANAACVNTEGSYRCSCNTGYQGNGLSCTDKDECADSSPCAANAACKNTDGGFECSCNTGYQGDGFSCTDINECLDSSSCDGNAACRNTDGGFECKCNDGYQGDGFSCTVSATTCTPTPPAMDVVFMLDASRSVTSSRFAAQVVFIKAQTEKLLALDSGVRVAELQYSRKVETIFCFNSFADNASLLDAIASQARAFRSSDKPEAALDYLRSDIFTEECGASSSGNRLQVAVWISDGRFSSRTRTKVETVAASLRESGVVLATVGFGSSVKPEELAPLAFDPSVAFTSMENFDLGPLIEAYKETLTC